MTKNIARKRKHPILQKEGKKTRLFASFFLYFGWDAPLRRRWANKPLNTFTEALEVFRTAIYARFFNWVAWEIIAHNLTIISRETLKNKISHHSFA